MRNFWVGLAASLAVLSAPAGAQDNAPPDTIAHLIGTWTCRSAGGSFGVDQFTRNADGSIANTIRYHFQTAPPSGGEYDAVYRYNPANNQWSWTSTTPDDASFTERATATPASPDLVVFEGTQDATIQPGAGSMETPRHIHNAIRVVYAFLSPNEFRRDFEVNQNGLWRPFSSTACARMTSPPVAGS